MSQNGDLLKEKHGDSLLLSCLTPVELGDRSPTVCEHTRTHTERGMKAWRTDGE